jgi:hypothetical protein
MWRQQRIEPVVGLGTGWAAGSAAVTGSVPADAAAILRAGLATVAGGGLLAAGLVLAVRLVVAPWEPPAPLVVLATGLAALVLVRVADLAPGTGGLPLVPLLSRAGLVATVAAMSLTPRTGAAADWVTRGVVIAAAMAALPISGWRSRARPRHSRGRPTASRPTRRLRGARRRLPGILRQRFTRVEQPDGSDAVSGTLVVSIPAGAKAGSGHVGFCPSFAALPSVEVTTRYDGVEATVGAAEILPWGLRVECRLADPAEEPLEIPVTIVARTPPPPATLP